MQHPSSLFSLTNYHWGDELGRSRFMQMKSFDIHLVLTMSNNLSDQQQAGQMSVFLAARLVLHVSLFQETTDYD